MTIRINDQIIIDACSTSLTMAEAASKADVHYNTFIRHAKRLGVYQPNQGGRGTRRPKEDGFGKIPLEKILKGMWPEYQTFKLKHRLFEAGLKQNKCEQCGISEWNGKHLSCELDHVNGKSRDHKLQNLKILCPNCHSQTDTFRSKNMRK